MHMLHIDGRIKPGRKEEFLQAWNNEILPLMKKQYGFVDDISLLEDGSNTGIDLSFWDAQEEAEQYQHNVFEKANGNVEHLLEGKFTVYGCGCDVECFRGLNRNRAA